MTTHGRAALVGVLQLLAELLRVAEVQLGADAGRAQRLHHLLVVGDALLLHHRDDDGAVGSGGLVLVERGKRRLQARHADGEAGGRHLLAGEAGDEIVVAPAAADRAEADRAALLVLHLEGQLGLEHRAGVVLEPADDRRIDD